MNWPVHADSVDFDRLGGAAIAGSAHPPTQIWVPRRAESTASLAAELNAGNRQGRSPSLVDLQYSMTVVMYKSIGNHIMYNSVNQIFYTKQSYRTRNSLSLDECESSKILFARLSRLF